MDWFEFTDLPQLQSVKLNNNAFQKTKSFEMLNLTSIQSLDIGEWCFGGYDNWNWIIEGASSFSLKGMVESIMKNRPSSSSVGETG